MRSGGIGNLNRLEAEARKMTMARFSKAMATTGFLRIEGETLDTYCRSGESIR